MIRFTRIVALALLLAAAPLAAAQPPSQAQVDRLLEVMRARETLDAVLPQVQASQQQMVAQMTAGQELDEEERAKINRVMEITNTRLAETLTWEKMEPLYRDIYARTFTGEDVLELHGHGGPVVMDMLLKACLGISIDAERDAVRIDRPTLPERTPWLRMRGLRVGPRTIDLQFTRNHAGLGVAVLAKEGATKVLVTK